MGESWWNIERKKAYASTDFHCEACWVEKSKAMFHAWLEAHERYSFDYPNGRMTFLELVPLCHSCHNYIHSGRLRVLVDKGEIPFEKMEKIVSHGDGIIKAAKIRRPRDPKKIASWKDWRVVVKGKEYGPAFATFEDWLAKFHPGEERHREARQFGAELTSFIMPSEDSQAAFEMQNDFEFETEIY